jgi:hypothetical protein
MYRKGAALNQFSPTVRLQPVTTFPFLEAIKRPSPIKRFAVVYNGLLAYVDYVNQIAMP